MEFLKSSLNTYPATSVVEKEYKSRMLNLLNRHGHQAFTRDLHHAHFTASAWILNKEKNKVLLLHHTKLNKWLQPGGHADGEMNLLKVARKEAAEESNLTNLKLLQNQIFDIDIHVIPKRNEVIEHEHFDVRFIFTTEDEDKTQINNESKGFKWVNLAKIDQLTNEESILRMLRKSKSI